MSRPDRRALATPDPELDRAAEVTADDIQQARETARRHSRDGTLRRLLDAVPDSS